MFRRLVGVVLFTLMMVATAEGGTVVVPADPGTPILNGIRFLRALNRIPSPSATDRWLIKLEPGTYDLGTRVAAMRPFVDIEGSGQGVTTITSAEFNTVVAASNAEIRALTIQNTFPGPPGPSCTSPTNDCHAVLVETGSDAVLTDVTIHTTSGSFPLKAQTGATVEVNDGHITCADFCHGVQAGGTATLRGTTITAFEFLSRGVDSGGTINLVNVSVDVGTGSSTVALQGLGGVVNVHNSIVRGEHFLIFGGEINIGASQVELFGTTTGATCVASYNTSFSPLGANCQPLP